MIDKWLTKTKLNKLVENITRRLFLNRVSANQITIIALILGLMSALSIFLSGIWIWNASLSSYFGLPFGGGYSAPKAALLNLAESLQPELLEKGIKLQVINHGFVKTRLTHKNKFEMPQLMLPQQAAMQIIEQTEKPYRFEIHFPFKLSTFLQLLKILPYKISLAITRRMIP